MVYNILIHLTISLLQFINTMINVNITSVCQVSFIEDFKYLAEEELQCN